MVKENFSGFAHDDNFLREDREKLDEIVESLRYCIHTDGTALVDV